MAKNRRRQQREFEPHDHYQPPPEPQNDFEDSELECADCRNQFVWTAGEQAFFAQKQFTPPRRCKPCRDKRKAEKEARG